MKALKKLFFATALLYAGTLWGQSTYQGQLNDGGEPYNGTVDLSFQLYDEETGGNTVGVEQQVDGVAVIGGLFQAEFFLPGTDYGEELWLEVIVDGQILSPRQKVTAAPWAKHADRAVEASEAQNFSIGLANASGAGSLAMGAFSAAGGTGSFAGGVGATANHDTSFIWSGAAQGAFGSTANNQFRVRAPGGAHFEIDDKTVQMGTVGDGGAALVASKSDTGGRAVHGSCTNGSGTCRALYAFANSPSGFGVYSVGAAGSNNYFERAVRIGEFVFYDHQPSAGSGDEACWVAGGDGSYILRRCSGSSARLKKEVENLDIGLDLVRRMRPVSFVWKENGRADIGLIAEEVAELDPRLAKFDQDGRPDGVDYRHLSALLIQALQEREAAVDAEFARVRDEYESQIAVLQAELDQQHRDTAERLAALESLLLENRQLAEK